MANQEISKLELLNESITDALNQLSESTKDGQITALGIVKSLANINRLANAQKQILTSLNNK